MAYIPRDPEHPQKQLGKTKDDLRRRAMIAAHEIVKGATTTAALIVAGYSEKMAQGHSAEILRNPVVASTFREILDAAGVSDRRIAEKISSLLDAKETRFFCTEGTVTDERTVADNATQMRATEFAAKLRGHAVDKAPEGSGGPPMVIIGPVQINNK